MEDWKLKTTIHKASENRKHLKRFVYNAFQTVLRSWNVAKDRRSLTNNTKIAVFFREYATSTPEPSQNMKCNIVAHSYGLVGFTRKLRPNIRFSLYTEQTQRLHLNITYSSEAIDIQIDESVAVGASNDPNFRTHLPRRRSLTSLAALSPSALRFLSIILLRSTAALSSALSVQPILIFIKKS